MIASVRKLWPPKTFFFVYGLVNNNRSKKKIINNTYIMISVEYLNIFINKNSKTKFSQ